MGAAPMHIRGVYMVYLSIRYGYSEVYICLCVSEVKLVSEDLVPSNYSRGDIEAFWLGWVLFAFTRGGPWCVGGSIRFFHERKGLVLVPSHMGYFDDF